MTSLNGSFTQRGAGLGEIQPQVLTRSVPVTSAGIQKMLRSIICPVFMQFVMDSISRITWEQGEPHFTCLIIHFILSLALKVLISKQDLYIDLGNADTRADTRFKPPAEF